MAAAMTTSTPMMEKASAGMRDIISALSSSEARYFDEERFSEAEVRKALSDSLTDRKIDGMKRILAAVSVGRDASPLFPDVVKNVSFQSLELKKLIYIYLVQYAENNRDLALLSINSFQKDLSDRSQLVRASALRAMASIKVLEVIQLVMVAVRTASSDMSPYVRKTAAQCMIKVYAVDADQFLELRALLLKLMSDHEVQVVGSAIMAFHHIVVARPPPSVVAAAAAVGATAADGVGSDGGGEASGPEEALRSQLALLHPHFRRLCQDVLLMDSWAQQCCLDLLLRYCRLFFASPEGRAAGEAPPEDLAAFLKTLKLLLNASSKGVTLAAVVALCYLAPREDLKVVTMPILRCLRQAPAESAHALLVALLPIAEASPELVRPSIREFFVQSFDFQDVKQLKLKILERLADETNVQLVLRELQAYVSWQSLPDFVALAVQSIAKVALRISSVADPCLRGLVKMLDSKCEVLSCEAVVALRALLQRRRETADSGLGAVLPHLARYLEDLQAPTARASVVWIIGQYQREEPRLAPDVVRRLAKGFATERQEVKQQILGLSLKVWAFHSLNAMGGLPADGGVSGGGGSTPSAPKGGGKPQECMVPDESAKVLPRLEKIVDHISELASYDAAWDVRDTARALKRLRDAAKAGLNPGGAAAAEEPAGQGLAALGVHYCKAAIGLGEAPAPAGGEDEANGATQGFGSTWMLGSLAQALDFPLETYRPLPGWATEDSPDELRKPKVEEKPQVTAPKSISSSTVGHVQHMETRVQAPSNITNMPVVSSLEDLDLFYTSETPAGIGSAGSRPAAAARGAGAGIAGGVPEAPPTTLEQLRLGGGPPTGVVGTAVFGEDDESEEEDSDDDAGADDDDDWKYCAQASQSVPQASATAPAPPAPAASATPAPAPTEAATAVEAERPIGAAAAAFEPPPREAPAASAAQCFDISGEDVESEEAEPAEPEGPAASAADADGSGAAAAAAAAAPAQSSPEAAVSVVEESLI